MLQRIERERFAAPRLKALEAVLTLGTRPRSRRIADLRRLVSGLDATRNQLFAPVAAVLFLRSQLAVAMDRWYRTWGPSIPEWLRVVCDLEALAPLAAYAYEHHEDPFPTLIEDGSVFHTESLAHPLIRGCPSSC